MPAKKKIYGPPKKPLPKKPPRPIVEFPAAVIRKSRLVKSTGPAYHTREAPKRNLLINGLKTGKAAPLERRRRKRRKVV